MRISYTYKVFSDCPEATDYSKTNARTSAYFNIFIILGNLLSILYYVSSIIDLFSKLEWVDFFNSFFVMLGVIALDLYHIVVNPLNVDLQCKLIVLKNRYSSWPPDKLNDLFNSTKKNENKNIKHKSLKFILFFLAGAVGLMSVIGIPQSIYFLCHRSGGIGLLIGSLLSLVLIVFSTIILNAKIEGTKNHLQYESNSHICNKCGSLLMPDSVFCTNCGEKVQLSNDNHKIPVNFNKITIIIFIINIIIFLIMLIKMVPGYGTSKTIAYIFIAAVTVLITVLICRKANKIKSKKYNIAMLVIAGLLTVSSGTLCILYEAKVDAALADVPDNGTVDAKIVYTSEYIYYYDNPVYGVEPSLKINGIKVSNGSINEIKLNKEITFSARTNVNPSEETRTIWLTNSDLKKEYSFSFDDISVGYFVFSKITVKIQYVMSFWDVICY